MESNSSPVHFVRDEDNSFTKFQRSKPLRRHSLAPTRSILKQRVNDDQNHTIHIIPNGDKASDDTITKRRRVSFAPEVTLHKIHIDSGNRRLNINNINNDNRNTLRREPGPMTISPVGNKIRSPIKFDIQAINNASQMIIDDIEPESGEFAIFADNQNDETTQSMEITQLQHDTFNELFGEDNSDELDEETMELTGPLRSLKSQPLDDQKESLLYLPGGQMTLVEHKAEEDHRTAQNAAPLYEESDEDEEENMESTQQVKFSAPSSEIPVVQANVQVPQILDDEDNDDNEEESLEMEATEQVRLVSKPINTSNDIESLKDKEATQDFVISQNVATSTQNNENAVTEEEEEEAAMELTRHVVIVAQGESSSQDNEVSMELTQPVEAPRSVSAATPQKKSVTQTPPSSGTIKRIHTLANGSPQSASKTGDHAILKFTPMKSSNVLTQLVDISAEADDSSLSQTNDNKNTTANESYAKTYTVTTTIPLGDEEDVDEDEGVSEIYTLSEFLEEAKISFNDDIRPNRRSSIEQFTRVANAPASAQSDYIYGIEQIPDLEYFEHAIKEFERGLNNTKLSLESFEKQMESENPRIVQDFFGADILLKISLRKNFQILKNRSRIYASSDMRRFLLGWLENLGTKIARHGEVISNNIVQLQLEGRDVSMRCHELKQRKAKLRNKIQELQKYQSGVYSADKTKIKSAREQLVSSIDKVLELREQKLILTESLNSMGDSIANVIAQKETLEREHQNLQKELRKNKSPSDELLLGLNHEFELIQSISGIQFDSFADNVLSLSILDRSLMIHYDFSSKDIGECISLNFAPAKSKGQLLELVKAELLNMVNSRFKSDEKLKAYQVITRICQIWTSVVKMQHSLKVLRFYYQLETFKVPQGIKIDLVLFKSQFKAVFSFVINLDILGNSDRPITVFSKIENFDDEGRQFSELDALKILKRKHTDVFLINRLSLGLSS